MTFTEDYQSPYAYNYLKVFDIPVEGEGLV